jgi:hypothetical protein
MSDYGIEIEMAAAQTAPIGIVATQTAPRPRLNSKLFCVRVRVSSPSIKN